MIYFLKEKLESTDCDIIMHECFCKITDLDDNNQRMFRKYKIAKKSFEQSDGEEIDKIRTFKMVVDEEEKKIIANIYSKLSIEIEKNVEMRTINKLNFEETMEVVFRAMKRVKEKRPEIKIGLMRITSAEGRDTMKLMKILMEKSNEYDVDIHILV